MNFKTLTLYSAHIDEQCQFYNEVLGFILLEKDSTHFAVRVGKTVLRFVYREEVEIDHFAFNIPSNQEKEALNWLKERLNVLPYDGDELIDFPNWNAKTMYFYDADGNILEFIARKNLQENQQIPFSIDSVLEVSEIGLPTGNLKEIYHCIGEQFPIPIYSGSLEQFCALGNERGLLIVVDKNSKKWLPNDEVANPAPFNLTVTLDKKTFDNRGELNGK